MQGWKFWERGSDNGLRRTWPQRLAIGFATLAALACFATAVGLGIAQWVVSQRQLVTLDAPSEVAAASEAGSGGTIDLQSSADDSLELVEPDAANFLLTGSDSGTCDEQNENPALGERTEQGRSDTIMLWRVNPETNDLAVLSFPRDLYVERPGGFQSKINAAYKKNDPSDLVNTLYLNFGLPVDHYVQVDLCAFETLVDAVDGVEVPFAAPVRDAKSGLAIDEAGCVRLDGTEALAYVRSRSLQILDEETGEWSQDPTADLGRISRQQDFTRRLIAKVIDDGLYSPSAAGGLIETNREYVVTDSGLTINRMLEFANTLKGVDVDDIASYQIDSYADTIGGTSIQRMEIEGENMQAILQVFRGQALLSDAPPQDFEDAEANTSNTTTPSTTAPTTTPSTTPPSTTESATTEATDPDATSTTLPPSSTTLPTVFAEQETIGEVPVDDRICS